MSLYAFVDNDCESSIIEVRASPLDIIPCAFNQVNTVDWILDIDAKNVINCEWQTATFVTMMLKYMERFVYTSTII